MKTDRNLFWACCGASFLLWALWCVLMVYCGSPFSLPLVRALVRIGVVAIPSVVYLALSQKAEDRRFGLTNRWKLGVGVGIAVAVAHAFVLANTRSFSNFSMPVGVAVWLNYIVFSPAAEELLFRRVAVTYLVSRMNVFAAIVLSAILFSLFHLPWWLISGEKSGLDLMMTLGNLFLYGIVFAVLYQSTKSLWASLIPHWVNNFLLLGLAQ